MRPWTSKWNFFCKGPESKYLRLCGLSSLACVRACVLSRVQLFVTPQIIACQAPLSMGFSRQEYQSGQLVPTLEDLPNPGIEPVPPALAGGFFTTEPSEKVTVSVATTQIPPVTCRLTQTTCNKSMWLCGSETWLTKTGDGPRARVRGPLPQTLKHKV